MGEEGKKYLLTIIYEDEKGYPNAEQHIIKIKREKRENTLALFLHILKLIQIKNMETGRPIIATVLTETKTMSTLHIALEGRPMLVSSVIRYANKEKIDKEIGTPMMTTKRILVKYLDKEKIDETIETMYQVLEKQIGKPLKLTSMSKDMIKEIISQILGLTKKKYSKKEFNALVEFIHTWAKDTTWFQARAAEKTRTPIADWFREVADAAFLSKAMPLVEKARLDFDEIEDELIKGKSVVADF